MLTGKERFRVRRMIEGHAGMVWGDHNATLGEVFGHYENLLHASRLPNWSVSFASLEEFRGLFSKLVQDLEDCPFTTSDPDHVAESARILGVVKPLLLSLMQMMAECRERCGREGSICVEHARKLHSYTLMFRY